MNWEFVVQKLSETSYHIAILLSVVSLIKLGIIQWAAVKICSIRVSKIEINDKERKATFSHADEKDKIVQLLMHNLNSNIHEKNHYDDVS